MAALSPADPTWPIEPTMACRFNATCSLRDRN